MRKKIIKLVWRNFLWRLTGLSAGMVLILVFLQAPVIAGDIENKLSTNNGTTAFEIQDSDGKVVSQIDSIGRVGMGTTNPQGKLHILSGSGTDPYVFVTSHTTAGFGIVVTTDSKVGIGTADPGGLLGLSDANTYIDKDGSNNMTFTDAVTGTKTLAQLATGFSSRCSVYRGSSNQDLPADTWTKVQFNAEHYDNDNEYDSTTDYRFTAKEAGYYSVKSQICCDVNTTRIIVEIQKNGVQEARSSTITGGSCAYKGTHVSKDIYLNGSTDYIEIWAYCNLATTLYYSSSGWTNWLTIHRF